jgi:predicted dithiol-disulfide oxidoreductase (DUF899 family)
MTNPTNLPSAGELAAGNTAHFPNESAEYRRARNALLAEEIDLRRHIERVAVLRRSLPPGGTLPKDYEFVGEAGATRLSALFGDKSSLVVYSYMFGPKRARPCPMCTSLLSAWDGEAADIQQRVALAVVARSPIERLLEFKRERGWRALPVYSDPGGDYTRDYIGDADADMPGFTVFTRQDGTIRHFWSGEMGPGMSDPGQDPRGAPDLMPLWTVLDNTPEGRGTDWYPSLQYR